MPSVKSRAVGPGGPGGQGALRSLVVVLLLTTWVTLRTLLEFPHL